MYSDKVMIHGFMCIYMMTMWKGVHVPYLKAVVMTIMEAIFLAFCWWRQEGQNPQLHQDFELTLSELHGTLSQKNKYILNKC